MSFDAMCRLDANSRCARSSRARARDMDAEDARGYFGDEVAGATLDRDARETREAAETLADCDDAVSYTHLTLPTIYSV